MSKYDVIIIGAGLSGLTAADELSKQSLRVLVLEAAPRVGGRTFSEECRGAVFDRGGQWVAPPEQQPHIHSLISDLGLELHEQHVAGDKLIELRGTVSRYTTDIPTSLGVLALLDTQILVWRVDALAAGVDPAQPHAHPRARELDGITCQAAMDRYCWTANGRALFEMVIRGILGCEPGDVSFLHLLAYVASAGGFRRLVTAAGGFQHFTILGGAQQMSERLAARVRARPGCDVRLGRKVVHVRHSADGVQVTHEATEPGAAFGPQARSAVDTDAAQTGSDTARRLVVACPPSAAAHMVFQPPLPAARRALARRLAVGSIVKAIVLFRTAFWRDAGLSGEALTDGGAGPVFQVFDDSLPLLDASGKGGSEDADDVRAADSEPDGDDADVDPDCASAGSGVRQRRGAAATGGESAAVKAGGSGPGRARGALQPALVVFMNGELGRWAEADAARREAAVTAHLSRLFGGRVEAEKLAYLEQDWSEDPHTGGAPVALWPPGVAWSYGHALRRPVGSVFWAGTEAAVRCTGFMDGAVLAGRTAAADVAASLDRGASASSTEAPEARSEKLRRAALDHVTPVSTYLTLAAAAVVGAVLLALGVSAWLDSGASVPLDAAAVPAADEQTEFEAPPTGPAAHAESAGRGSYAQAAPVRRTSAVSRVVSVITLGLWSSPAATATLFVQWVVALAVVARWSMRAM